LALTSASAATRMNHHRPRRRSSCSTAPPFTRGLRGEHEKKANMISCSRVEQKRRQIMMSCSRSNSTKKTNMISCRCHVPP
jgi:hypothetical protein